MTSAFMMLLVNFKY